MNSLTCSLSVLLLAASALLLTPGPVDGFVVGRTARPPSTASQLSYSNGMAIPTPSYSTPAVNAPQQQQQQQQRRSPTKPALVVQPTSHPDIQRINSMEELDECLGPGSAATVAGSTTTTTTVVVRFYSETCRACKASKPAFYRLVSQCLDGNDKDNIQFLDVPAGAATKAIYQRYGITRLPWGQVYHSNQNAAAAVLVHEGSLTRTKFSAFERNLKGQIPT